MINNRSSFEDYEREQKSAQIINVLLSNPIVWFGDLAATTEEEAQEQPYATKGKMITVNLFKANDITLGGIFGEDVYVLIPNDAAVSRLFEDKKLFSLKTFYLPYHVDACIQDNVASEAEIIVTPSLTGCCFVAERNSATPLIAHINRQNSQGETDSASMEQDIQKIVSTNSKNYFVIRKNNYYEKNSATTVFGIKLQNEWIFICDTVKANNLIKVVTNMKSADYEFWRNEQAARSELIFADEMLKKTILDKQNEYQNYSSNMKTLLLQLKNKEIKVKLSEDCLHAFQIIERAKKGELKWSVANSMIKKLTLPSQFLTNADENTNKSKLNLSAFSKLTINFKGKTAKNDEIINDENLFHKGHRKK